MRMNTRRFEVCEARDEAGVNVVRPGEVKFSMTRVSLGPPAGAWTQDCRIFDLFFQHARNITVSTRILPTHSRNGC